MIMKNDKCNLQLSVPIYVLFCSLPIEIQPIPFSISCLFFALSTKQRIYRNCHILCGWANNFWSKPIRIPFYSVDNAYRKKRDFFVWTWLRKKKLPKTSCHTSHSVQKLVTNWVWTQRMKHFRWETNSNEKRLDYNFRRQNGKRKWKMMNSDVRKTPFVSNR